MSKKMMMKLMALIQRPQSAAELTLLASAKQRATLI
jgi:hypothetical protein